MGLQLRKCRRSRLLMLQNRSVASAHTTQYYLCVASHSPRSVSILCCNIESSSEFITGECLVTFFFYLIREWPILNSWVPNHWKMSLHCLLNMFYIGEAHCLRVSIAMVKHHGQKRLGEERVYFSFHFHITIHQWGKSGQEQGKNLEAETDGRGSGGVLYWLLPPGLCSLPF